MTDSQKPGEGLTSLPGLQLLGGDTAMGVCADGVCSMPGSAPDATAEKDEQD